jgi:F-type H+-transporting ATPase subunit alpha
LNSLSTAKWRPLPVEEQVVAIFAGVKGYLDKVPVTDVTRFEKGLMSEVRAKHADILKTIREEQKISDATEASLKGLIEKFAKAFA